MFSTTSQVNKSPFTFIKRLNFQMMTLSLN